MTEGTPPHSDPPLSRRAIILLFIGLFILLAGRSMHRDLDPDEHQFVAPPALLVQDHLLPYVDYPYFHMPNLVFIYAALTGWTSYKLLAARMIMSLCGTATVVLLIIAADSTLKNFARRDRHHLAAALAVLFICCRMFTYTDGWAWNHDMPVLCTLGALMLYLRGMRQGQIMPIVIAGFLLGLATGIRLSFALAPIPFVFSIIWGTSPLRPRKRALALLLGTVAALIALTPAIFLMLKTPDRFFFGNLGYPHLSTEYYRSIHYEKGMTIPGKFAVLLEKFLLDPGNAALLILFSAALVYSLRTRRRNGEFAVLIGILIALLIGTFGPTPFQPQYAYMLVPFMLLVILCALATQKEISPQSSRKSAAVICWLGLAVGVVMLPLEYWSVVLLPLPNTWKPIQQHHRALWIKSVVGANARVMTNLPAVPLEAGLEVYPEYAVGRFVLLTAGFQPEADRRKYGMISKADLPQFLAQHPPDAVFYLSSKELQKWAQENHYRRMDGEGGYTLWLR